MWSQRQRAFTLALGEFHKDPHPHYTSRNWAWGKWVYHRIWSAIQQVTWIFLSLKPGSNPIGARLRGWEWCECDGGREMTGAKLTGMRRGSLCWGRAWPETQPHWAADTALRTQIRNRHGGREPREGRHNIAGLLNKKIREYNTLTLDNWMFINRISFRGRCVLIFQCFLCNDLFPK